jgi:hypothetical protein
LKVVDLDNNIHSWNFSSSSRSNDTKSGLHNKAREVIQKVLPNSRFYEDITIPGFKPALYADFFIPSLKIMVEVNGQQHYKFTPRFHKDKMAYFKAVARDRKKSEFCKINDICLVIFDYNNQDQWENILNAR